MQAALNVDFINNGWKQNLRNPGMFIPNYQKCFSIMNKAFSVPCRHNHIVIFGGEEEEGGEEEGGGGGRDGEGFGCYVNYTVQLQMARNGSLGGGYCNWSMGTQLWDEPFAYFPPPPTFHKFS